MVGCWFCLFGGVFYFCFGLVLWCMLEEGEKIRCCYCMKRAQLQCLNILSTILLYNSVLTGEYFCQLKNAGAEITSVFYKC